MAKGNRGGRRTSSIKNKVQNAMEAYGILNGDELEAIDYYVADGYGISYDLRTDYHIDERQQEFINSLDSAISKGMLETDAKLYRGVGVEAFGIPANNGYEPANPQNILKQMQDRIGVTYTDKGYMSTSIDKKVAQEYANKRFYEGGIMLEINAKKGTNALYVGKNKIYGGEEKEMLFGRNKQYTPTKARIENGIVVVTVDLK